MIEEHALRYLLARQIWVLRDVVMPEVYEEVSNSLKVVRNKTEYIATWTRRGRPFEKTIPRSDYTFYRKGDRPDAEGVVGEYEAQNVERARRFALEALDLGDRMDLFDEVKPRPQARDVASFVWSFAICSILAASGSPGILWFALLLLAALMIEFVPRWGRLLASLPFYGMAYTAYPLATLFYALAFAGANFLDPNTQLRRSRTALAAGAGLIAVANGLLHGFGVTGAGLLWAVLLGIVLIPAFLFRWTAGIHHRALPVLLPILAPAFALTGAFVPAAILTLNAYLCAGAALWAWRLLPHPNAATFQGVSRVSRQ